MIVDFAEMETTEALLTAAPHPIVLGAMAATANLVSAPSILIVAKAHGMTSVSPNARMIVEGNVLETAQKGAKHRGAMAVSSVTTPAAEVATVRTACAG